ncbi:MAG: hypothetical protein HYX27_01925 [Acidobacteria bacterium]|nr:hypothetical protein [Acidobacteriota bacterium]
MIDATQWNLRAISTGLVVALTLSVTCSGSLGAAEAESFPADSPRWQLGPKAKITNYLGRHCLALEDEKATLKDFEITDGVIDVDMAGTETRGFYNISFRTQANGEGELVYLRAHKTGLDDAQQYSPIFKGVGPWQIYNGSGFTAAVAIPREAWFHVRLEITGAQAKLYVSNMAVPSLVVNDLKSGMRKGGVGFYGVHISNVEIRRMPPAAWERHEPAMPAATITKWSLSPSMDALERDLERPLSKSETDSMKWQEVTAEPPGFVVINRYRKGPDLTPTFFNDFSKRLEPQKGMQVVYARTTILSDRDQVKKLNIGYSDDVSLFLSDRILYRGRSAQRFRDPGFLGILNAENDAIYLPLKKGRNELVLAVSELTGGWGFICRFDDMNGIH